MCTVLLLRRPGHSWPILLAANRDEMADRPWQPPARHWPQHPHVVAGRDTLGGGTWLGINDDGVIAAVLNRINSLGPLPGARSRGVLPLIALAHTDAAAAAETIAGLDPAGWRPFNLVIADRRDAFWVRAAGLADAGNHAQRIEVRPLPEGLAMLTAHDLNDAASPRIRRYLPRFAAAEIPDPAAADWHSWEALLADRTSNAGAGPGGSMAIVTASGFGTVCSSLLALPQDPAAAPVWRFAAGRPDRTPFVPVDCSAALAGCRL